MTCFLAGNSDTRTGDSLAHEPGMRPPENFLSKLKAYIARSPIRKQVTISIDKLEHGMQEDSFSCAICAENTAARAIYGAAEPLWTSKSRDRLRIIQFVHFARACLSCQNPMRPDIVNLLNKAMPDDSDFGTESDNESSHRGRSRSRSSLRSPSHSCTRSPSHAPSSSDSDSNDGHGGAPSQLLRARSSCTSISQPPSTKASSPKRSISPEDTA